jgi:hypothetical protein
MRTRTIVAVACVTGSTVGLLMVFIAVDHNPQEAFISHATGAVDYLALTWIFLPWFVLVGAVTGLVLTPLARSD